MSQGDTLLHVHDLPQLYQKPPFQVLIDVLNQLQIYPTSFGTGSHNVITKSETGADPSPRTPSTLGTAKIDPTGIPRYLTSIIASPLAWLQDDTQRERIWDLASIRLSERSGRTAMPSITRTFTITTSISIKLFEPSLTGDNLGFKTWTSSLLLAKRLASFQATGHIPSPCRTVLELGSGTGLVGIAAGCVWATSVTLTDLPAIVPNLQTNVESNSEVLRKHGGTCQVRALDWADEMDRPACGRDRFQVILAADPIYTPDHPRILVDTVKNWLDRSEGSRFIVELPVRERYGGERDELQARLRDEADMEKVDQGTEIGYDDWQAGDGQPAEVECWWSVWRPVSSATRPE